jgi:hypothetical protein
MAVVDDTAGVEMKEEEGSYRSSHPPAPNLEDLKEEKSVWKQRKKSYNRLACCVFCCFAGNGGAYRRRGKEQGRKPLWISATARISPRRVNARAASGGGPWRRRAATIPQSQRMPRILQHCSRSFFCNFQMLVCIFRLLAFYLFWTFDIL